MRIEPDSRIVVGLGDQDPAAAFRTDNWIVQVDDGEPFVAALHDTDAGDLASLLGRADDPGFEPHRQMLFAGDWRPYAEFTGRQFQNRELLRAVCDEAVRWAEPAAIEAAAAVALYHRRRQCVSVPAFSL